MDKKEIKSVAKYLGIFDYLMVVAGLGSVIAGFVYLSEKYGADAFTMIAHGFGIMFVVFGLFMGLSPISRAYNVANTIENQNKTSKELPEL